MTVLANGPNRVDHLIVSQECSSKNPGVSKEASFGGAELGLSSSNDKAHLDGDVLIKSQGFASGQSSDISDQVLLSRTVPVASRPSSNYSSRPQHLGTSQKGTLSPLHVFTTECVFHFLLIFLIDRVSDFLFSA